MAPAGDDDGDNCEPQSNSTKKDAAGEEMVGVQPLAMDFSTVTVEQFEAFPLQGGEWDTYKVYFNEFPTERHRQCQIDAAFQPFDMESEVILPEPLTESEMSQRSVDDHTDPLGWPYHVELLDRVTRTIDTDAEADDNNLLGSTQPENSETFLDMEKAKQERLAQYHVVKTDETSLADSSSSNVSDEESVVDDVEENGYQSQEDDEDSVSIASLGQKLQISSLVSATNNSTESPDGLGLACKSSEMQERSVGQAPGDESADPSSFDVSWAVMKDGSASSVEALEETAKAMSKTAFIPLLRPPPQERMQKWLNEKSGL